MPGNILKVHTEKVAKLIRIASVSAFVITIGGCISSTKNISDRMQVIRPLSTGKYLSDARPNTPGGNALGTLSAYEDGYAELDSEGKPKRDSFFRILQPNIATNYFVIQNPQRGQYYYVLLRVSHDRRNLGIYAMGPKVLNHLPNDLKSQIKSEDSGEFGSVVYPDSTASLIEDLIQRDVPTMLVMSYSLVEDDEFKWILPLIEGSVIICFFALYFWQTRRPLRMRS